MIITSVVGPCPKTRSKPKNKGYWKKYIKVKIIETISYSSIKSLKQLKTSFSSLDKK